MGSGSIFCFQNISGLEVFEASSYLPWSRVCSNSGYYVPTRIWATDYNEGSESHAELALSKAESYRGLNGGFPKLGVPFVGVPIIRYSILGSI